MRRIIVPFAQLTSNQLSGGRPAVGGSGCVTWHSSIETGGTNPAEYQLWDGPPAAGQLLADVALSASQSTRDFIGLHALPYIEGLFVVVVSGALRATLSVWGDHVCQEWYERETVIKDVEAAAAMRALGS